MVRLADRSLWDLKPYPTPLLVYSTIFALVYYTLERKSIIIQNNFTLTDG